MKNGTALAALMVLTGPATAQALVYSVQASAPRATVPAVGRPQPGTADFRFEVQTFAAAPVLLGLHVFAQVAGLDPPRSVFGGITISGGLQVTVGW